eukprot:GFYU01006151.1.p1 GENE.GFYU01006151.1~~GFYU01006151.1.p1  ORF type:complete len:839 (-),score=176.72 GFYU01006151.1:466-2982(-)
MSLPMYYPQVNPLPGSVCTQSQPVKKQPPVKKSGVACLPCNKSKARCGAERPCKRCVKNGISHLCVNVTHQKAGRKKKVPLTGNEALKLKLMGGDLDATDSRSKVARVVAEMSVHSMLGATANILKAVKTLDNANSPTASHASPQSPHSHSADAGAPGSQSAAAGACTTTGESVTMSGVSELSGSAGLREPVLDNIVHKELTSEFQWLDEHLSDIDFEVLAEYDDPTSTENSGGSIAGTWSGDVTLSGSEGGDVRMDGYDLEGSVPVPIAPAPVVNPVWEDTAVMVRTTKPTIPVAVTSGDGGNTSTTTTLSTVSRAGFVTWCERIMALFRMHSAGLLSEKPFRRLLQSITLVSKAVYQMEPSTILQLLQSSGVNTATGQWQSSVIAPFALPSHNMQQESAPSQSPEIRAFLKTHYRVVTNVAEIQRMIPFDTGCPQWFAQTPTPFAMQHTYLGKTTAFANDALRFSWGVTGDNLRRSMEASLEEAARMLVHPNEVERYINKFKFAVVAVPMVRMIMLSDVFHKPVSNGKGYTKMLLTLQFWVHKGVSLKVWSSVPWSVVGDRQLPYPSQGIRSPTTVCPVPPPMVETVLSGAAFNVDYTAHELFGSGPLIEHENRIKLLHPRHTNTVVRIQMDSIHALAESFESMSVEKVQVAQSLAGHQQLLGGEGANSGQNDCENASEHRQMVDELMTMREALSSFTTPNEAANASVAIAGIDTLVQRHFGGGEVEGHGGAYNGNERDGYVVNSPGSGQSEYAVALPTMATPAAVVAPSGDGMEALVTDVGNSDNVSLDIEGMQYADVMLEANVNATLQSISAADVLSDIPVGDISGESVDLLGM